MPVKQELDAALKDAMKAKDTVSLDAVRSAFGDRAAAQIGREVAAVLAEDPDGLVERTPDGLQMTERGRPFVRSICARFDAYLSPEPGVVRHSIAI